ncbi:hypothetical protein GR212_15950 [Rhizobium lusitanum]|uniref:Uncharacterized protein n=1 Tax=Rhizobium lusitanum TaxID=293958 RepID=A0A6L9U570_9HYPH|nr:hypothetical protein [Rhizobium lusitanum]NEI71073.1 hypothetical protein [Rhizobium lusitanum]
MTETPRQNTRMLNEKEKSYETHLFSNDHGMWTVYEIIKRPIAKVASQVAAEDLIRRLKIADTAPTS